MEFKRKEPLKSDSVLPKIQDSVYYAKEKKKTPLGPLVQSGAGNGAVHLLQAMKSSLCVHVWVCMVCSVYGFDVCGMCVYMVCICRWYVVYVYV